MLADKQQLLHALIGSVITLLGVGVPLLNKYLTALTQARIQSVLGAVHAVDNADMSNEAKKVEAVRLAAERLPSSIRPSDEQLGQLVEQVMPAVKAGRSEPPPT